MNGFTTEELKIIAELCDAAVRSNGIQVVEKISPLFNKVVAEINRREPQKKEPPAKPKKS